MDIDKIECESCGATLKYVAPDSWTPTEGQIYCYLKSLSDFVLFLDYEL